MNQERIYQVLIAPHVSEKASNAGVVGQHVFKVAQNASKREIKIAIESLFGVQVSAVQTITVKGKRKRFGQRMGKRSNWKKAVVRLSGTQDVDFTQLAGGV